MLLLAHSEASGDLYAHTSFARALRGCPRPRHMAADVNYVSAPDNQTANRSRQAIPHEPNVLLTERPT
jgi:hypothetical protein